MNLSETTSTQIYVQNCDWTKVLISVLVIDSFTVILRKKYIVLVALKMKFQILCPQTPLQLPFLAKLLHIKRLKKI